MNLDIEKARPSNDYYLRAFKVTRLPKNKYQLLICKSSCKYNITIIRPFNINTRLQHLREEDIFPVFSQIEQWFWLELKDFSKKRFNVQLINKYCSKDKYARVAYKDPCFHFLCKLERNTLILFRNSHLSKREMLSKLERIFIHEMAHVKWLKLPLHKKIQYYFAYKKDGGFSPSIHTKGNIKEDFAARVEEFIKFGEEYSGIEQMRHRFEVIREWMGGRK